ncbi:MAG: hypothetical protein Q4D45_00370 [Lachnospiraceae bacterium]|nr:hypothetical protein [Lachnospiraceae bacterium]
MKQLNLNVLSNRLDHPITENRKEERRMNLGFLGSERRKEALLEKLRNIIKRSTKLGVQTVMLTDTEREKILFDIGKLGSREYLESGNQDYLKKFNYLIDKKEIFLLYDDGSEDARNIKKTYSYYLLPQGFFLLTK